MSCVTSGTILTPHSSKPNESKVCLLEATPGISSWISKPWTTASYGDVTDMRESIESRNSELRTALGLGSTGGSTNQILLEAFYYYDDKSLNTGADFRSWENPNTVFPLFNVDNPNDIDARWPDCATKPGQYQCKDAFVGNQRDQETARHNDPHGTRNGWTLASHAELMYLRDSNKKEFPYGCRKNSSLYKIQGFYGITIACDRTQVTTQLAKAIVINQVAYTKWESTTDDPIPFTRMAFMFIVGEYERETTGGSYKYRMCTAWRDYLMQEIVFLDFCFASRDDAWYFRLRSFFSHVSGWNEADGASWLLHLATAPPKIWTETLRNKQARLYASHNPKVTDVQKWEIARLVAKHIFRIPPMLRTLLLPDTDINSGDTVWFVLDWPTCPRRVIYAEHGNNATSYPDGRRYKTVTGKEDRPVQLNTSITLTDKLDNKKDIQSYSLKLASKSGASDFFLKSGMAVRLESEKGDYALSRWGINLGTSGLIALTPAVKLHTPATQLETAGHHIIETRNTTCSWIVYKDAGGASPASVAQSAPAAATGSAAAPVGTGSATSLSSSAAGAVTPLTSAVTSLAGSTTLGTGSATTAAALPSSTVLGNGTSPSASFVAESADWAFGYALTASAVAAVSLFSLDAVSYFGDKETGTSKPIASDATETVFRGASLSALVASAVAYDAVDAPTLFGNLKRPSGVDAAAQARLGVVAVAASEDITLTCLTCSPRVAKELATRPSATSLDGASFLQMQLLTDYTSSYFLRANKTKRGKLICRAFRLVPYNICAILVLVGVVVMLVSEGSPATRRIRRVSTAARGP
jgi:hypothetical protein